LTAVIQRQDPDLAPTETPGARRVLAEARGLVVVRPLRERRAKYGACGNETATTAR